MGRNILVTARDGLLCHQMSGALVGLSGLGDCQGARLWSRERVYPPAPMRIAAFEP